MDSFFADKLEVQIYRDRESLGRAVANDVSNRLMELLKSQDSLRMIFAAAPSQNELLQNLVTSQVDWSRISAFHMDEYLNISKDAPQSFGNFLSRVIFNMVGFKEINLIDSQSEDPEAECLRYAKMINASAIDVCAMGIGENGHMAFNDPPVADFSDPLTMKIVELDQMCRQQQVNDGCFSSLSEVPEKAFTLTISALVQSKCLFVTVPGKTKAEAIKKTIYDPISSKCPSTLLRSHSNAKLYIDEDSASLL